MKAMHKLVAAGAAGAAAMYFLKPMVEKIVDGVSGVVSGRPPPPPQPDHSPANDEDVE